MTLHLPHSPSEKDGARKAASWAGPLGAADRYLEAAGVNLSFVRADLIRAAAARLEVTNRSSSPRIREVRMLACVERVLCERLGARPGSDTSDPDTARRRLMFSIEPTMTAQLNLLKAPETASRREVTASGDQTGDRGLTRIPPVRRHKPMPRQAIDFRRPTLLGLFGGVPQRARTSSA